MYFLMMPAIKTRLFLLFPLLALAASPLRAQDQAQAPAKAPVDMAIDMLGSKDPSARRQAIEQLSRLRDHKAVPALMERLGDENPYVRAAAADCLGLMRALEAAGKIAAMLTTDKDKQVRQSAAIALTYMGDPSTADALIQALGDSYGGARYAAARSLGSMHSTKAVAPLVKTLKDPDPQMRAAAAGALGLIGAKDAVPSLIDALKDAAPPVRQEAAKALGALGDPAALEPLKKALADADMSVRIQAASALGRMGDASGVPLGVELLKSPEAPARQQAATLLGLIGDKEKALPALETAYIVEKDPATKPIIDYGLTQLRARLGVKGPPAAAAPAAASMKPPAKTTQGTPGKAKSNKKPGPQEKSSAPVYPKPTATPQGQPKNP